MPMSVFELIKERTDCLDLAQDLGLNPNTSGMILCPDPAHVEKTPSFKIYHDGFYCFGCQRHGSAIDLVMLIRGWDLITAARWLADRADIPWPEKGEEAQKEYERQLNRQQEIEKRLNHWARSLRPEDVEYLKRRGFTEEFIKEQGFGYCGQRMPQDLDTARQLGLLVEPKDGRERYMPHDRLTIPLFQYGKPAQVALHKPGGEPKYLYPSGWPKPLVRAYKRGEAPFLVEGVFDYFSLLQTGLPAMASLGTQLSTEQRKQLGQVPAFIIAFDGDEPGKKAAGQLAKEFFPAARVIDLPDGKDVNDLLRKLGQEKFREFMLEASKEAMDSLDMALARLKEKPDDEAARKDALSLIAKIASGVDREIRTEQLAKTLKPLAVSKTAIREEIGRLEKKVASQEAAGGEEATQADQLIKIAVESAFLFHDETKDGFARFEIDGHREIWPLSSKFFKHWLTHKFYERTEKSPSNNTYLQALNAIQAKAIFDGSEHRLHLRIAEHDGALWYDLANEAWQAVKITRDGWETTNDPPILFRRFKNTAAQALPEPGGNLELMKKYINLQDEEDWQLLYALIIHAFIPGAPHGVPVFYGDKGSAKTTAQRVIRKLIDPAHRDTMTLPADKNELALMLMTNYAPCFDNLDGLQPWQSDMLCQAATGGGISKRELYTDMDEVILSFLRCPMLNGINLAASRDDLLDRSVLFRLERIGSRERKTERRLWREFERDRPYILGAIFAALSGALKVYPKVRLNALPRMADFAEWGYAIMEAIDGSGDAFLKAYYKNIAKAVEEAVLGDMVGAAMAVFMEDKETWEGTATELLNLLGELPGVNKKEKYWPKRPNTLARRLNKIKSALADYGIGVDTDARTANQRYVTCISNRKTSSLLSYRHLDPSSSDSGMTINAKVSSLEKGDIVIDPPSGNPDPEMTMDMTIPVTTNDDKMTIDEEISSCDKDQHNRGKSVVNDDNDGNDDSFPILSSTPREKTSICKHCGEPIEWARDEEGKWLPMKPDYTGFHRCKKGKDSCAS